MSKIWALIGIAAAVGTGYVLGKKFIENNPEAFAVVKGNCSDTFHKASVYCAGAVRTGSEKLSKSVNKIVEASKAKGTDLVKKANTKGNSFKNEINNLKDMVVSINKSADVDIYDEDYEIDPGFTYHGDIAAEIDLPEVGSEAL